MVASRYLIDSNVVADFVRGRFAEKGHAFLLQLFQTDLTISIINKIELLTFRNTPEDEVIAIKRILGLAQVIQLDEPIVEEAIRLRSIHNSKLPDAIIAATALVNSLKLITGNVRDFSRIKGLSVFNSEELKKA